MNRNMYKCICIVYTQMNDQPNWFFRKNVILNWLKEL